MTISADIPANPTSASPTPIATRDELDSLRLRICQMEEELAQSQQCIVDLRAQYERLILRVSRSLFAEKDYENFDPSEYTVPVEEMLADARKSLLR